MAETSKKTGKSASAAPTDLGYLAEGYKPLSLHPMVAHQMAAFAAATAIGFSFASRMTSLVLGGMQEPVAVTFGAGHDEDHKASATLDVPATTVADAHEQVIVASPAKSAKPRQRRSESPEVGEAKVGVAAAGVNTAAEKKPRTRQKASDLKRISGIGPKIAELLDKAGVKTFADIAGWTESDVARIDRELGLEGRILRDDWIGQAKTLKNL